MRYVDRVRRAVLRVLGPLLAFDARDGSRLSLAPLAWPAMRRVNQRRIRARCMALWVSDGVAACRVLGRFKMYVQADDHAHAAHLMFDGYWEMPVTEVVAALVRPGMVAVDAGANQGYYTLLLAELVGPDGRVHAVEPNPRMVALVGRSLAVNGLAGRVRLHAEALGGPVARRVVLRVPEGTPSGAYVEDAGDAAGATVTRSLDAILGDGRLDFIKIDAEGSEMAIWEGMRGILGRGAPLIVVMEFLLDRAPDAAGFLDEVAGLGFTLSCVDARQGLRAVTAGEVLASAGDVEWMLVLRRGA